MRTDTGQLRRHDEITVLVDRDYTGEDDMGNEPPPNEPSAQQPRQARDPPADPRMSVDSTEATPDALGRTSTAISTSLRQCASGNRPSRKRGVMRDPNLLLTCWTGYSETHWENTP